MTTHREAEVTIPATSELRIPNAVRTTNQMVQQRWKSQNRLLGTCQK